MYMTAKIARSRGPRKWSHSSTAAAITPRNGITTAVMLTLRSRRVTCRKTLLVARQEDTRGRDTPGKRGVDSDIGGGLLGICFLGCALLGRPGSANASPMGHLKSISKSAILALRFFRA